MKSSNKRNLLAQGQRQRPGGVLNVDGTRVPEHRERFRGTGPTSSSVVFYVICYTQSLLPYCIQTEQTTLIVGHHLSNIVKVSCEFFKM